MNNLQTRLIISFALVILVTICGVTLIFSILSLRNPQQERITFLTLNTQARSIVAVLRRLPDFSPTAATRDQLLEELSLRQNVRVGWASPDLEVQFDSTHVWDAKPDVDLFSQLNQNAASRWTGQIRDAGRRWLVVAHPLSEPPQASHYLILAQPVTRPVTTTFRQLRETVMPPLLQAGTIALAIGIILSITISRSIAKPLRKVSDAAQALADGNYNVSVQTSGPQEIQQLSMGFNKMAKKINASQQAQNDLVANIAHDLRTPLTSIQGYAQALLDGTAGDDAHRLQAARIIYDESRRMDKMAKILLDISKFQAGEIMLQLTPVNIVELLHERQAFFSKVIEDAGLTIETHTAHQDMVIHADHERLIQVVDNLINNAIAYTKSGGKITLDCSPNAATALISVADTGAGIPKTEQERIFERFYRSDKSRQGTGTGLGLAIVKEIVSAHKGEISVESIEGVGSKFTIILPNDPERAA